MPRDSSGERLTYAGQVLERVSEFKYLGLLFTTTTSLAPMWLARLVAAKKAWGVL